MGLSRRKYAALLLVQLSCIFGVNAVPAPQVTAPASGPLNPSACASVASITSSLLAVSPRATPTVPATLAIECLQTVPNKVEPAQRLIKSLKAFLGWQSTLAFLKDPPQSYMFPPVDIMAGFDNISATVASGGFTNEFDFGLAIVYLIQAAHDGHFAFRPDVFRGFGFRNRMAMDLVSVSVDGIQVPKLYHFSELNATAVGSNGTAILPRAIVQINGEDAATVIARRNAVFSLYQDADSQWNSVMRSYAFPGASTFVAASLDYQGPNLTLTYDNGDSRTEPNFAIIRDGANFTGVNTGEDYYQRFCNPDTAPQAATATSTILVPAPTPTQTAAAAPTISGYPFPVIRDSGSNTTSGYFLNGTGYEDVAVLAVTSFSPGGDMGFLAYMTDFQRVIEEFLALCKANNKKKLVIDLAANGGGYIVAGYELFNQIFPGIPLFRADNLRETESLRQMAEVSGEFLTDILNFDGTGTDDGDADADTVARNRAFAALQQSPIIGNIVPGGVYAPDGTNLTTVDAILDPVILKGDRFTAYAYTPLNETSAAFNISGTGSRSNLPPAVFAPEDVVLLTDGTCGSTCTLFAYLMIQQLDVKATVVGGRPRTGPMQSVAGVEGAQVFFLPSLQSAASAVLTLSPDLNTTDSELAILEEGYALRRAASPANPGGVNGKNAFMKADAETPLQFLYQAANCRFFYTREMLFGPGEVWKRAVDATWTDPEAWCVEGSRVATNLSAEEADGKFFLNSKIQQAAADSGAGSVVLSLLGGRGGVGRVVVWAVVVVVGMVVM